MRDYPLLLLALICICLIPYRCFGQGEALYWHFGFGAGLDFSNGAPVAFASPIYTLEGSASISDQNGVLFYTSGDTIYDASNQPIPNSVGLAGTCVIFGGPSSSQNSMFVRQPGHPNIYYLFTTDCQEDGLLDGMQYHVLDKSLRGGLGDLVLKNQQLLPVSCEKVTATLHANGCDIWIVTHDTTDAFYTYLLSDTGISTPVISHAGQYCRFPISVGSLFIEPVSKGYLKFSNDGTKLVSAFLSDSHWQVLNPEVLNFNKGTGVVTADYVITSMDSVPTYGTSFSADGSKLYFSGGWYDSFICQYDLQAGNLAAINASKTYIYQDPWGSPGALQMGPDGKIYVALSWPGTDVSVINSPNLTGSNCDFVQSAVVLTSGAFQGYGLPNFAENHVARLRINYDMDNFCFSDSVQFYGSSHTPPLTWLWDFGDPASGIGNISTLKDPKHLFSDTGIYVITLYAGDSMGGLDSVTKELHVSDNRDLNFKYLAGCAAAPIQFTEHIPCQPDWVTYDYGDGSPLDSTVSPAHTYAQPGTYQVTLTASWPDGFMDTVLKPVTILPDTGRADFDYYRCSAQGVSFVDRSTPQAINWEWDFGDGSGPVVFQNPYHYYLQQPSNYAVTLIAQFGLGCTPDTVTKQLSTPPNLSANILVDTACVGDSVPLILMLDPPFANLNISDLYMSIYDQFSFVDEFQKATNTIGYTFQDTGTYQIIVYYFTSAECIFSLIDTIVIQSSKQLTINSGALAYCVGDTVVLNGTASDTNTIWNWNFGDGSLPEVGQNQLHPYDTVGTFTIVLSGDPTQSCTQSDSSEVTILEYPQVDLGKDTVFCDGSDLQLTVMLPNAVYNWSTGDTTQTVVVDSEGSYWVEVHVGSCATEDTIDVTVSIPPMVELGKDTVICAPDTFWLSYANMANNLEWSTGDSLPQLMVVETGSFWLKVTDSLCSSADTIQVTYITAPAIDLGPDTNLCPGEAIKLDAGVPVAEVRWSNGSTTQAIEVTEAGWYWAEKGPGYCFNVDSVLVETYCQGDNEGICDRETSNYVPPNVFSPNGDGKNDLFLIEYGSCRLSSLQIYNRWGQLVFETTDPTQAWDGVDQPTGNPSQPDSYYYIIFFRNILDQERSITGYLQLIR